MTSQIIERSFQLAMHAASAESFEAFETAISRLRTLDRHNEIPVERYLALDGIAHARAGHIAQAKEALSQLLKCDQPLAEETKRLLLSSPEASHESFRKFVEEAIPNPDSPDSDSVPKKNSPLQLSIIAAGVIVISLLVGMLAKFTLINESSSELENIYSQMQQVVCKVVLRAEVLRGEGKTVWIPISYGTGFVVSKDGLILTNRHVIEGGPEYLNNNKDAVGWDIQVVFGNYEKPLIFKAIRPQQSSTVDVAWFKVDHKFEEVLYFASAPAPGQNVKAYGFPGVAQDASEELSEGETKKRQAAILAKVIKGEQPDLMEWLGKEGLTISVTKGVVSALHETEEGLMVQTDTFVHSGNSGGPLVDEQGRVVGMVTLRSTSVESTNFCIASSTIFKEIAREPGITWPDSW